MTTNIVMSKDARLSVLAVEIYKYARTTMKRPPLHLENVALKATMKKKVFAV